MSNTISRRSLAKGAAWSVPAVVAASTVPALAASPNRDCAAAGPYLRVNTLTPAADLQMTDWWSSTGDPRDGFGTTHLPSNYLALPVDVVLTEEFAPGAQATLTIEDVWISNRMVVGRDASGNPIYDGYVTSFFDEHRVTPVEGDPVIHAGWMDGEHLSGYEERKFVAETDPSWLSTTISTSGTTITITLTNTGTEAMAGQEARFVVFIPLEPIFSDTDQESMEPPYLAGRVLSRGGDPTYYTVAPSDTSGCTYAPMTGEYTIHFG